MHLCSELHTLVHLFLPCMRVRKRKLCTRCRRGLSPAHSALHTLSIFCISIYTSYTCARAIVYTCDACIYAYVYARLPSLCLSLRSHSHITHRVPTCQGDLEASSRLSLAHSRNRGWKEKRCCCAHQTRGATAAQSDSSPRALRSVIHDHETKRRRRAKDEREERKRDNGDVNDGGVLLLAGCCSRHCNTVPAVTTYTTLHEDDEDTRAETRIS